MTVSIIIPCYRYAHLLGEAIESCLNQTHPDIEIIVVDDGSPDNTREVVARYPQVNYVYQENAGVAAARNTGIAHAAGAFFQFLDADDVLLPEKISRSLAAFEKKPSLGVVYTNYEKRSADLETVLPNEKAPVERPQGNPVRKMIESTAAFFPPHCALTCRVYVEKAGGFTLGCDSVEDWNFWIKIAAAGAEFSYVDEVLCWYRDSPGSLSSRELPFLRARLNAMAALQEISLPPEVDLAEKIAGRHHALAMALWEHEQREEARQHFRQAIALHPQSRAARQFLLAFTYVMTAPQANALLEMALKTRISG
ncbi:MAG: glycosyltransferase family 2 protein [Anaerolineae bacterium]|nr:glycosyltransferase family 2 protein [Anaerolineae bacterium]